MKIKDSFLLVILIVFSASLAISPEFLYNQKEFNKSRALTYHNFGQKPTNIFSYQYNMKFGIFNYYSRNPSQAERYFAKALKIAQDSLEKADAYYWCGRSSLALKKSKKASYCFNQTLNYNKIPESEFLYFYGIALYNTGKFEDALNCFQNFETQTPSRYQPKELSLFIAASALGQEDYALAESILSREEMQDSPIFYPIPGYLLGLNYYLINENKKSLSFFRMITSDTTKSEITERARLISGTIYLKRDENVRAATEFDAIINDTIGRFKDQAYLRAGISYYRLNKTMKATERFDSLVAKYPASPLTELVFYYRAKMYEQNRKWTKAKTEYRKFLASYTKSALSEQVNVNLGRLLFLDENYVEAIPLFEDFLNNFQNSKYRVEILYYLIQSDYKLKKYNKAQFYGDQFIREFQSAEKATNVYYILGEIGIIKNDFEYSRKHFSSVMSGNFYPYALKSLGDLYFDYDSLPLALNYYDLAEQASIDTLIDEIRYKRGEVLLKQNRYKNRADMLNDYLQKYPLSKKVALVQYEIGQYYLQQNDASQAIIEFDKVYSFAPTAHIVPQVEIGKGEAYTKLDQHTQAIACYLKVVNDFPSYILISNVITSLASLYYSVQNYDSAIILYNRLISDFPKTQDGEDAFIELAKTYRTLGSLNESVKLLERFIIRYPDSNRLKEAYFELADLYKDMGKVSQAEKIIKETFTEFGKTGDGYFKLGAIDGMQDKFSTAKAYYLNAYDFYIKEQKSELAALSLFEAGKCAMALQNWTDARESFNRCINTTQDERLRIECENQIKLIPNQ